MLIAAIILFAAAALGGIYMATKIRQGAHPPMGIALVHGAAAATGLVLVLVAVLQGAGGSLPISLGLFVVAALGGFALFAMHLKAKPQPFGIVAIHAVVAVTAFVVLLIYSFG